MKNHLTPWTRLAQRAQSAPAESTDLPLGFTTRVVARWRSQPKESAVDMLEWLTVRGLAVALGIFLACAAFGYDSFTDAVGPDTAVAGNWLQNLWSL